MNLTDKQYDVLRELRDDVFLKPMDFGAWDASHHSGTARRLAKQGLVEMKGYRNYSRSVYSYRRTPAGSAALEAERKRRESHRGTEQ